MESIAECPICGGSGLVWGKTVAENGLEYENVRDCDCRLSGKTAKMLRRSGFDYARYEEMSLANFKADTDEAAKMKSAAQAFLDDPHAVGLGYFGASGTGKTHICIAVCRELTAKRHIPHLYFEYRKQIHALKALAYKNHHAYAEELDRVCKVPVLYIDDLFKLAQSRGSMEDRDLQIMYSVINDRYINKRKTLFSSEYALKKIAETDEATGSRIYEMCRPHIVKCEGENRRIKTA